MNILDQVLKNLFFHNRKLIYIISGCLLLIGIIIISATNKVSDIEKEIIKQGLPNPVFSNKEALLKDIKITVKEKNTILIENNTIRDIYGIEIGKIFIKAKIPALSSKEIKTDKNINSNEKVVSIFVD